MSAPVGVGQLVCDQEIGGFRVGHAQKRLGERKQRCTFFRTETIFLKELVHPAIGLCSTQIGQQASRIFDDSASFGIASLRCHNQRRQYLWFWLAIKRTDGGASGIEC
jgi:hypothetical protein